MSEKQKSTLFDEELADKEIIKNLLSELTRRNYMSTLVQDTEGNLLAVHQFEELTLERAKEIIVKLQEDEGKLQAWITKKEAEVAANPPAEAAPETPATPETPAQPEAPTDPNAAAPAAPTEPAPTDTPPAPAEQPVAPAEPGTPATDPAGNPITLQ